jgi:hypothetical protein
MSLNVWTQASGYVFTDSNGQPFQEQIQVDVPLPVANDTGVSYSVISGNLPGGLGIVGNRIKGSPYIISNLISYKFCIRATKGSAFADRTFSMAVNGANPPEFITAAGSLAIGIHRQLYALDGTYITYQIEAFDLDVAIGETLKYFIASGDGKLPPGLTLSDNGLISGYIIPVNILVPEDGTGQYDVSYYDKGAYDFGLVPSDGFDSYEYEYVPFDYNSPSVLPKSLNANYQFKVSVSDGTTVAQRIFKIFVVGSDEFRADSTSRDGFAGQFTSDSTYLRNPVWITDTNLGIHRANNYLTVPIALYDSDNVLFRLETTNCEIYAVTKRLGVFDNVTGQPYLTITNVKTVPTAGQSLTFEYYISGATDKVYLISHVATLAGGYYRLTLNSNLLINIPDLKPFFIGSLSKLPPGVGFDVNSGDIFGRIPYQPAITQKFTFTITATRLGTKATEKVDSNKTFSISILGSITSQIVWNSPSNLGSVPAAYISNLSINATSNIPGALVLYAKTGGTLPPGLTLSTDGEIVGVVNQFYNATTGKSGITRLTDVTFDRGNTTFDCTYKFTVEAYDQYQYSASPRDFSITVTTPNTVSYSTITARPFLAPTQRAAWQGFINDANIFTPASIYRISDPSFGVQSSLNMLVYAGIESTNAAAYVGAMGLNHKRKRFKFGDLKSATAVDANGNELYETIYIQMLDPAESNGNYAPLSIKTTSVAPKTITVDESTGFWSNTINNLTLDAPNSIRPDPIITVDSTGYEASNPNTNTYFPNSISNWQGRLKTVGLTERNYLPLWMRSIPKGSKEQLGYVLCIPLCFCKPGTASTLLLNIKYSGFDFKNIDYTVDRFTISAITGDTTDKYLVFRNDRITV